MSVREISIREFLLQPIATVLGCPQLPEQQAVLYIDAVRNCTDTELRDIYAYLRDNHKYKRFPSVADIQAARREVNGKKAKKPHSDQPRAQHPWEDRAERIKQLAANYVKNFMETSLIAMEARRDGWDYHLMRYVTNIANLQAQMICNDPHPGYDGNQVWGAGSQVTREQRHVFERQMRQQADSGMIEVSIPTGRIDDWKSTVEHMKKTGAKPIVSAAASAGVPEKTMENMVQQVTNQVELDMVF